jgi:hypothetical protein
MLDIIQFVAPSNVLSNFDSGQVFVVEYWFLILCVGTQFYVNANLAFSCLEGLSAMKCH